MKEGRGAKEDEESETTFGSLIASIADIANASIQPVSDQSLTLEPLGYIIALLVCGIDCHYGLLPAGGFLK
ncbi:hypothetical protein F4810DRAFT_716885 [Camillea tinctor]|nr:hypothetical protein F4810DRAFT_716885 [Camillea tinctor]